MNLTSEVIDINEQRYSTCGDYQEDTETGILRFKITKQPNKDWESAVFLHEYIEFILCRKRGISEQSITKYDMEWEERNPDASSKDEPGLEPDCPYHKEHIFAMKLERLFAEQLGINWDEYDNNLIFQQNARKHEG